MRPYASMAPTQSAGKFPQMHVRAIYVDIHDMRVTSMYESLRTIHGIMLLLKHSLDTSMLAWDEQYMVSY